MSDPKPEARNRSRTTHQVSAANGDPYQAHLTDLVWVTKGDPYMMTAGNSVTPLLTGEAYFTALAAAIQGASKSIYMLGWQINWDVMLQPGVRLYDALLNAAKAKPALKIYVLPWAGSSQVPTYVDETVKVLESINTTLGTQQVFAKGADAMAEPSKGGASFFSHHQKQAVIDERIGFVGGIDVAYGRRDNASYTLDAAGRQGNDSYNGCLPHLSPVMAYQYVAPDELSEPDWIVNGDSSVPNLSKQNLRAGKVQYPADGKVIKAATQPRMPWQDVHLRVEGPAVSDLASNFVLRWNSATAYPRLKLPPPPTAYAKSGGCQMQLLRSASGKMVQREFASVSTDERGRVHHRYAHNHIHWAMVRLIEGADHFIYIENQFFVSAFGQERFGDGVVSKPEVSKSANQSGGFFAKTVTRAFPGDSDALPANLICSALGDKLRSIIMNVADPQFHIYITLPVHPEGLLNDVSVMTQVHYTMQSLVFGSQSLVNRTRRALLARKLWKQGDQDYARVFEDKSREYESIPIEACWQYLTLMNLRSWVKLGDRYVTEQIYVHTKVMIVDDRYALVGSANINDRSQLGTRDSEMAVLVVDTATTTEDIGAKDGPQLTRKFARELRMGIWNKLFALTGAKTTVHPAESLIAAVKLPAAEASWQAIRDVAKKNTDSYEAAFDYIPRNRPAVRGRVVQEFTPGYAEVPAMPTERFIADDSDTTAASIWPRNAAGMWPFDKKFWDAPRHGKLAASLLPEIRGFISLLPWRWTQGENNNYGYHSALYVENHPIPSADGHSDVATLASAEEPGSPDKESVA